MKTKTKLLSLLAISSFMIPVNTFALTKQEVVFTNLSSNGEVKENIVNTHLKYVSKEDIEDETILKNILNISGDEKINLEGNKLTIKSKGKDITYQGNADKPLPISTEISYYLDGKKLSKKEMINKKGRVDIEIKFINNAYDENYKLYTPFVVTTASIINGKNNSNFSIDNGKVVNTGTKNVVVGISSPGLYDNLGISELKSLDTITISYDTKKFTSSDVYFVATPKLLSDTDLNVFEKLDNLSNSSEQLQDGVNKLVDGADKLTGGATTLNEGTQKLKNSLATALDGAKKLEVGSREVDSNLNQIIDGLKQSRETLNEQSQSINQKVAELNTLKSNNSLAITNLTNANNTIASGVKDKTMALGGLDINSEEFTATIDNVHNNGLMDDDTYNTLTSYKAQYDGNKNLISLLTYNNGALDQISITLSATSNNISAQLLQLESYLTKLEQEGTSILKDGNSNLRAGIEQLYNGSVELTSGIEILVDGTNNLRDGIIKLNDDGISKLTGISKTINNYKVKVKNMITLSKNYNGYASSNVDETIFVYKINK